MDKKEQIEEWSKEAERYYRRYHQYTDERGMLCQLIFRAKVLLDKEIEWKY